MSAEGGNSSPGGASGQEMKLQLISLTACIAVEITEHLSGFEICRLWMTGDTRLQRHLENGGVQKFELKVTQRFREAFWPLIVKKFALLRTFTFSGPPKWQFNRTQVGLLTTLPKNLRTLHLPSPIPDMVTLASFPVLSELQVGPQYFFSAETIAKLPKSLTILHIASAVPKLDEISYPLPLLTRMTLRLNVQILDRGNIVLEYPTVTIDLERMQNLTYLSIFTSMRLSWTSVPTCLEEVAFPGELTNSVTSKLPSGLKSACTYHGCVPPQLRRWSHLPQSLTRLCFLPDLHSSLRDLPKTLLHLDLDQYQLDWCDFDFLPPMLTFLQTGVCYIDVEPVCFERKLGIHSAEMDLKLPTSLTELILHHGNANRLARPLPPNLRYLTCKEMNLNAANEIEWPSTMLRLCTGFGDTRDMRGPPTSSSRPSLTIDHLIERHEENPEENLRIPPSITELTVTLLRGVLLPSIIPNGLVSFRVEGDAVRDSSIFLPGWSKLLPPTITEVKLQNPIDVAWITNLNTPNLTALHAYADFPIARVSDLPKSLVELRLFWDENIRWDFNMSDFRHLRTFSVIAFLAASPPPNLIDLLPPRLALFHITTMGVVLDTHWERLRSKRIQVDCMEASDRVQDVLHSILYNEA